VIQQFTQSLDKTVGIITIKTHLTERHRTGPDQPGITGIQKRHEFVHIPARSELIYEFVKKVTTIGF